jgi:uncharacterized membrane protein
VTTWLLNLWDRLRNSLWFWPAVQITVAVILAWLIGRMDRQLDLQNWWGLKWISTTPASARVTLGTLVGGLVTVGALVFSLTLVTLSQTSSQFGSRLLRTFLNHNITQVTLGLFSATAVFCALVLRSVREQNGVEAFVPHVSVALAMLAAAVCLASMIAFFHYVVHTIQAEVVINSVTEELYQAIDRMFPTQLGEASDRSREPTIEEAWPPAGAKWQAVVHSDGHGYIQAVDADTLMSLACDGDCVFNLLRRPGHFVRERQPLLEVCGLSDRQLKEEVLAGQLRGCFLLGVRRTPRQDVECAVEELVQVALRALSPGINDALTAIACIDFLGAALSRLVCRAMPAEARAGEDGRLRVIARAVEFSDVLDAAFNQIRQNSARSVAVSLRLLEAISSIASVADRLSDRNTLRRHGEMVYQAAMRYCEEEFDKQAINERYDALLATLRPQ